jgi:hypothetical protein
VVIIIVWNLNFLFFKKEGKQEGEKEVKKQKSKKSSRNARSISHQSSIKNNEKVQFMMRKKSRTFSFIFFFTRRTDEFYKRFVALSNTHAHTHKNTCFKRVNNNNAGVRNLFPVV